MTVQAASLDAGIADLETKLAALKRERAGLSASATGGLSASQLESSEYLTLKARGIEVLDSKGNMLPFASISAAIDAKFEGKTMSAFERDKTTQERIKLKRTAERLQMGLGG